MENADTGWECALMVEVRFRVAERSFRCHLIQFMPDSSVEILRDSLDAFMASLA
jgi:hypothetical protein